MAEALAPISTSWNFIYGVFTVTPEMANATTAFIWVERYGVGRNMLLDAFSVIPVVRTCEDADFNRGLETGDLSWWKTFGQVTMELISPGYDGSLYAMKSSNRKQFWASPASIIKPECLEANKAFFITAKFKIMRGTKDWECTPGKYWGPLAFQHEVCPTLSIRADRGTDRMVLDLGTVTDFKVGEWNTIFGVFTVTEELATADSIFAWFTKFHYLTDIIIDDFSIQLEPGVGCELNILHNGDGGYEDTRSWNAFYAGRLEPYSYTNDDGEADTAIAYVGSKYWHEGVGQRLDAYCIDSETEFFTRADVRLFEADGTTPYLCDSSLKKNPTKATFDEDTKNVDFNWRCPVIAIATQNPGTFPQFFEVASVDGEWSSTGWNSMEGTFRFSETQIKSRKMWIEVHNSKPGLKFVVDNFVLKKVPTAAPTWSPTDLYLDETYIMMNGTHSEGKSVGPNIGENKADEFTLNPDGKLSGNYTFVPDDLNHTEMTFAPDENGDVTYDADEKY